MRTLFAFLAFAQIAHASQTVFISPPTVETPGLPTSTLKTLVAASLTKLGAKVASDPAEADVELRPSVLQLGSAYLVTISRFDKGNPGAVEKAKARQLEELDEVIHRVVRAVMTGRTVSSDARPTDVMMDEETAEVRRRSNRSGSVVAAGPAFLGNLHAGGILYYLSIGKGWGIGPMSLGVRGDFAIRPTGEVPVFADVNFNATYYFMDRDASPFLTGEFGFGFARDGLSGNSYSGIQAGGTLGLALFRTYGIHVEIGVEGAVIFAAGASSNPQLAALRFGASF